MRESFDSSCCQAKTCAKGCESKCRGLSDLPHEQEGSSGPKQKDRQRIAVSSQGVQGDLQYGNEKTNSPNDVQIADDRAAFIYVALPFTFPET